jgi:hypothetical protein
MADGRLERLFWRVADQLDYLMIVGAVAHPGRGVRSRAGDASRSAAAARSGADQEGFSRDRTLKGRACQSGSYRSAKIQRSIKRARITSAGGFLRCSPTSTGPGSFSLWRVRQHSLVLARRVQTERRHAYPPNCDFGSVRRRARHSAALDRRGATLCPLLAASTVLADLRGGRRLRYRHDNHHRAAPSAQGDAVLLLQVLRAALRLPTADLLRAAELFWGRVSPPVSRRWHNGGGSGFARNCPGQKTTR